MRRGDVARVSIGQLFHDGSFVAAVQREKRDLCVSVTALIHDDATFHGMRVRVWARWRWVVAPTVVLAGWLSGCRDPLAPVPLPDGAVAFTPEAVYRDWWAQMEVCSGVSASFDDVHWYVVRGEVPFRVKGVDYPVVGYWDPQANRIVLLEYLPNQRAPVIRHEALHAILRRTDHPSEYFVDRCGAVIGGPDSPD